MRRNRFILAALAGLCALATGPAGAEVRQYRLDPAGSAVEFGWTFGRDPVAGRMLVAAADLAIDFDDIRRSRAHVELDVTGAQAGFVFATQAMRGPKMLDAAAHPRISFDSTSFARSDDRATITGQVTIRGITRPMVLQAALYRPPGSDPAALPDLMVLLEGRLRRSDFGATGWADMVGDEITLNIRAHVVRID